MTCSSSPEEPVSGRPPRSTIRATPHRAIVSSKFQGSLRTVTNGVRRFPVMWVTLAWYKNARIWPGSRPWRAERYRTPLMAPVGLKLPAGSSSQVSGQGGEPWVVGVRGWHGSCANYPLDMKKTWGFSHLRDARSPRSERGGSGI